MVLQIGGRFDHLDQLDEPRGPMTWRMILRCRALAAEWTRRFEPEWVSSAFSRTCWYVETALEDKPHQFAAATLSDGVDFSYMQYMLYGPGDPLIQETSERMYGGRPTQGSLRSG